MAERWLYLVRHGEASGDDDDAELTSLGERQSDAIGRRLANVALTGVYHSRSRRAAQTAELIAGHLGGATPIESSLVADVIPSNPPRAALPAVFTEFLDRFSADQLEVGPTVARAALQRFASEPPEDSSELIVTHESGRPNGRNPDRKPPRSRFGPKAAQFGSAWPVVADALHAAARAIGASTWGKRTNPAATASFTAGSTVRPASVARSFPGRLGSGARWAGRVVAGAGTGV